MEAPLLSSMNDTKASAQEKEKIGEDGEDGRLHKPTLFLVATGLFTDFFLLTLVVPILPEFFEGTSFGDPLPVAAAFACKPLSQFIFNPLAGAYVDIRGPHLPLFVSMMIMFASSVTLTLTLAFCGKQPEVAFALVCCARVVQGFSSALVNSAGITLVVQTHAKSVRGTATGIATSGIALGALTGPPIGGALSTAVDDYFPFAIVAGILFVNCGIFARAHMDKYGNKNRPANSGPLCRWRWAGSHLLRNSRIAVICAACFLGNGVVGMIEPLFTLYIRGLHPSYSNAKIGLIFAAATLSYLVFTPAGGIASDRLARSRKRWATVTIGCLILSCALFVFSAGQHSSWAATFSALVLIGIGMAFIDAPSMSTLADIVEDEQEDEARFGSAFALLDSFVSLGYAFGPFAGALLQDAFDSNPADSFDMMAMCFGGVVAALLPFFAVFLRKSRRSGSTTLDRFGVDEEEA